ncbi:hypothetical protein GCM10020366_33550 [Saccharopolyspora gregorii]|uniref:Uncharacterized protein n=1 Tax=Saccharopolyspora gregorii TaxID=33914 RepID=A0ABP6RQ34_9PSEU
MVCIGESSALTTGPGDVEDNEPRPRNVSPAPRTGVNGPFVRSSWANGPFTRTPLETVSAVRWVNGPFVRSGWQNGPFTRGVVEIVPVVAWVNGPFVPSSWTNGPFTRAWRAG